MRVTMPVGFLSCGSLHVRSSSLPYPTFSSSLTVMAVRLSVLCHVGTGCMNMNLCPVLYLRVARYSATFLFMRAAMSSVSTLRSKVSPVICS